MSCYHLRDVLTCQTIGFCHQPSSTDDQMLVSRLLRTHGDQRVGFRRVQFVSLQPSFLICQYPAHSSSMPMCIYLSMMPCSHAPVQPCSHAAMHSCIHASMHPCIHASIIHASMHACIHPSIHQSNLNASCQEYDGALW